MIECDGVKAAEIVFDTYFSYLLPEVVEVEVLFTQYDSAARSVLMTVRLLTEKGVIKNIHKEKIQYDKAILQKVLEEEFSHWQTRKDIRIVIKVESKTSETGLKESWYCNPDYFKGHGFNLEENYAGKQLMEDIERGLAQ